MRKENRKFNNFPIKEILGLRGMAIDFTELCEESKIITIHINRDKRFKKSYCSKCGSQAPRERKIQRKIRDIPMAGKDVFLECEMFVVNCPICGQRREKLDFVNNCSRLTIRFESLIFDLACMTAITNVSDKYHLSWETVKKIDKEYLAERYKNIDYGDLEYVAMDEIANKKGHDYLSIVIDLTKGRVIWIGEGRKKEDIDKFYATLSDKQKDNIKAISIDMWPAYIKAAKEYCPKADIVFDKFHIIKKFGEVITKLRNAEYRKATEMSGDKEILRGTKWLLLKRKTNLSPEDKNQLQQLLKINKNLSTAYILKEGLANFWNYKKVGWAKKALDDWIKMAEDSGIRGIKTFVKTIRRHEYGILSHCRHPINNGKIEGINNKIKTLKRQAYGFHDVEYFKLKILETCKGKK